MDMFEVLVYVKLQLRDIFCFLKCFGVNYVCCLWWELVGMKFED